MEENKRQTAEQKAAMRMVNSIEKTREESMSAVNAEMWAASPFFADGHSRNPKVKIFSVVPDYAVNIGQLTYLWIQEVLSKYKISMLCI